MTRKRFGGRRATRGTPSRAQREAWSAQRLRAAVRRGQREEMRRLLAPFVAALSPFIDAARRLAIAVENLAFSFGEDPAAFAERVGLSVEEREALLALDAERRIRALEAPSLPAVKVVSAPSVPIHVNCRCVIAAPAAPLASTHEFGTGGIPPRPFLKR